MDLVDSYWNSFDLTHRHKTQYHGRGLQTGFVRNSKARPQTARNSQRPVLKGEGVPVLSIPPRRRKQEWR